MPATDLAAPATECIFCVFVCTVSELAADVVVVRKCTVCVDLMVQIELYLDMIKYSHWMEPFGSVVD